MQSRNHDSVMRWLLKHPWDYESRYECKTLAEALTVILKATREDAVERSRGTETDRLWPEGDDGIRYKVNAILQLIGSRSATGALEDFLVGESQLFPTDLIQVSESGMIEPRFGSRHREVGVVRTEIYKECDLPDRYKKLPIPSLLGGGGRIQRLFLMGIGD